MSLIFVNVQTGGLDPSRSSLVELAAIGVDPVAWFHRYVVPAMPVDDKAASLNGYVGHRGEPSRAVCKDFVAFVEQYKDPVMVAHNAVFAAKFLKAEYKRHYLALPPFAHMVDVQSATHLHLKTFCFDEASRALDGPGKTNQADKDVEELLRIYLCLQSFSTPKSCNES